MIDLTSINERISRAKRLQAQIEENIEKSTKRMRALRKKRDKVKELIKHFEITKKYIPSFDEALPDAGDG